MKLKVFLLIFPMFSTQKIGDKCVDNIIFPDTTWNKEGFKYAACFGSWPAGRVLNFHFRLKQSNHVQYRKEYLQVSNLVNLSGSA